MNQVMNQVAQFMDASIGASEAKAQLSRLRLDVEAGERFTITVRGKPVADRPGPPPSPTVPRRPASALGVAAAVAALQAFPRIRGVSDAEVADFLREGRP